MLALFCQGVTRASVLHSIFGIAFCCTCNMAEIKRESVRVQLYIHIFVHVTWLNEKKQIFDNRVRLFVSVLFLVVLFQSEKQWAFFLLYK